MSGFRVLHLLFAQPPSPLKCFLLLKPHLIKDECSQRFGCLGHSRMLSQKKFNVSVWVNKLIFFPAAVCVCVCVFFFFLNRFPLCLSVFCWEFDNQHVDCSLQHRVFCYGGMVSHLCLHAVRNDVSRPSDRLRVRVSCSRTGRKITCLCVSTYLLNKALTGWIQWGFYVKKSGAAALVYRRVTKPVQWVCYERSTGRCWKSALRFHEISTGASVSYCNTSKWHLL